MKLSAIASSCTTAELHSEAKQPAHALVICLLRLVPIMLYTRVSSSLGASCSKQELSNYSQQSIGKCATVGTLLHKQYFLCLEGCNPGCWLCTYTQVHLPGALTALCAEFVSWLYTPSNQRALGTFCFEPNHLKDSFGVISSD